MKARLLLGVCLVALATAPSCRVQAAASVGSLVVPPGVTHFKGLLVVTSVGSGPAYGRSADFLEVAGRLQLGIVFLKGENAFGSYANRCTGGEFKAVLDSIGKYGMDNGHPEMAQAPLVGVGHSHGGDYWIYFNACFPDRFAALFVKSSGGVQYMGAALRTPMIWEIGTNDLKNSMGHFRGDMFAHRPRGQILSLVLGPGEGHGTVTAGPRAMVAALVEAIFPLRVPADADPGQGPVKLNEIDESSGRYWLGDNYTKDISPFVGSPDREMLYKTSFLPSEEIAMKWKMAGAPLPTAITIATGGVCTTCYAHPASEPPGGPSPAGPQATPADGGAPPAPPDAAPDAESAAPPPTPPPTRPTPPAPSAETPRPAADPSGGCSMGGAGPAGGLLLLALLALLLPALMFLRRRRRRRR
jgi:hypothetical protein